ncbi:hypothetical protein BDZ85DRAFT_259164 [Elsinoe ampelina]|uniref:Uncharacterized protein n=1 Tax=Elsinoe ampelina TaxID=302913 RepID=A0A6A6GGM5_9PEZI|nr:hypothetical protein BDZ85DRAFT_259164 [Elsinoe ampelina]
MPGLTASTNANDFGRLNAQSLASLKSDLENCFTSQLASGTAAYHARYLQYPNPTLQVEGIGGIGLPLSDATALKTVATAREAPTDVDSTTWEVDASRVTFLNPLFQKWITNVILPDVLQELGIEDLSRGDISADLYKLILHGPAATSDHYPL